MDSQTQFQRDFHSTLKSLWRLKKKKTLNKSNDEDIAFSRQ